MSVPPPATVPSILLPEILGFSPQLMLDDIINSVYEAVSQAVDAMQGLLDKEVQRRAGSDASTETALELEQGLVAFQTLLDSHADIAFDFFEAWSLRNIFAIPADLPVVVPHQRGLNLDHPPEREQELMAEVEELRRKVDNMRRLQRLYTRAVRKSAVQLRHSEQRLERLSFLHSPAMDTLSTLPEQFLTMFESVSTLPPLDPSSDSVSALSQLRLSDPGKRQWETNKTGYFYWAVEQLLARSREKAGQKGSASVGEAALAAYDVGQVEDVKAALEAVSGSKE
ncbi:hypothetical protein JAAARDRAFT_161413 [Jaapia argillacea MUCL 33604]|uniref:Mis12 domain-containing protein n=1 Tax=Jaapia argillacea MUCL 33604 TaxID=933084 RepID=A0A067PG00_9AGAM|nr:hypothetical protein JAAARDRAFT_161413 [Jaapia argillacea MUCL 33604]